MFSPIDNRDQIFVEDDDYDMTMIHKRGQANHQITPFDELEYQFEDEDLAQVGLREEQEPIKATQQTNEPVQAESQLGKEHVQEASQYSQEPFEETSQKSQEPGKDASQHSKEPDQEASQ